MPQLTTLLVANRGEVAIRIFRAAAELGLRTVAVHSADDETCLHTCKADEVRPLPGRGAAAYLDVDAIVAIARDAGCDAIHPGYGFLAESAAFARRCAEAGIAFVGPRAELLELLGDKARARAVAASCGVPVLPGTPGAANAVEAHAFLAALPRGGAVVLKAVAGGGGRGLRVVADAATLDAAYARCRSEAQAAFGDGALYAERFLPRARHVEVQIAADGRRRVANLWERECSLQRRHQKLVEIAPSAGLAPSLRARLVAAARRIAEEVGYESLGTFEFLIDLDNVTPSGDAEFFFIEANPRLQVEHTVTEGVTGIDLVQTQLRLAAGASLGDLGIGDGMPEPRGFAMQLRINMERMQGDGGVTPAGGTLTAFEPPSGPGVRVDTLGYTGYTTNPRFDSLLAKLVVCTPSATFRDVVTRAQRALAEFKIEGIATNREFLQALLGHPAVAANDVDTSFVERHAAELLAAAQAPQPRLFFTAAPPRRAGAQVDAVDPLAVLEHGKRDRGDAADDDAADRDDAPAGTVAIRAPMQGTIVSVDTATGAIVRAGAPLVVMESMKMEHVVVADVGGVVARIMVAAGDTIFEGDPLAFVAAAVAGDDAGEAAAHIDLDRIRDDLREAQERHAIGLDAARPEAVARRRKTGQRTARENVADLCDPGTFVEYAPLVVAAQRQRRAIDDLIKNTPADGLVAGIGRVNGDAFAPARSRCVVLAYDYTVLAGTQGAQNHRKKDRMLEIAERRRLPVVVFTEGGGGRPGDTDALGIAGLDVPTFQTFARLSALVPIVGVNSGFCFAGNAALLGCCDVVIATANSNIGMGGPAMVEGGGLGVFRPEEIGPMGVQVPNGVIDVAVADEAAAVHAAKRYLSYFQGSLAAWQCADQRVLRGLVPENRLRVYDVRRVVETLADTGSVLELRRDFGVGMVTALARMEGRPLGIVANNPTYLAGAIEPDGADKAARFLKLCDAFDLPVVFLCDTPGIMVGPEIEKRALVRHAARLFVVGASLSVPFCTIVLRKGYGLGAMAMAGGSFKAPLFTVAWPTGEFGGMGLEGAVKLGFRKELAAVTDPHERRALFKTMVERMYRHGKAVSAASHFEIDDVINPAESRRWITSALASAPEPARRRRKKRPCIDPW